MTTKNTLYYLPLGHISFMAFVVNYHLTSIILPQKFKTFWITE
jgi:hypothetical protein